MRVFAKIDHITSNRAILVFDDVSRPLSPYARRSFARSSVLSTASRTVRIPIIVVVVVSACPAAAGDGEGKIGCRRATRDRGSPVLVGHGGSVSAAVVAMRSPLGSVRRLPARFDNVPSRSRLEALCPESINAAKKPVARRRNRRRSCYIDFSSASRYRSNAVHAAPLLA